MKELSKGQIEHILQMQIVGRLGIINADTPYIVPITYVFDGKHLYFRSKAGQKIQLMRKHPKVCFQVDAVDSLDAWRSVIITGNYQELRREQDIRYAVELMQDRFGPILATHISQRPNVEHNPPRTVTKLEKAIYFRINIDGSSGRYERP